MAEDNTFTIIERQNSRFSQMFHCKLPFSNSSNKDESDNCNYTQKTIKQLSEEQQNKILYSKNSILNSISSEDDSFKNSDKNDQNLSDHQTINILRHQCSLDHPLELIDNFDQLNRSIYYVSNEMKLIEVQNEILDSQTCRKQLLIDSDCESINRRTFINIKDHNHNQIRGIIQIALKKQYNPNSIICEMMTLKLCSKISNDCIMKLISCHLHENIVFFVTESINYEHNLKKWRQHINRVPQETELSYITFYCMKSLIFIYQNQIVHGQIRAANFVITSTRNIKLVNFSQAFILNSNDSKSYNPIGDVFWMAPEMLSRMSFDQKADLWSLGMMIIEIINGKRPFNHLSRLIAAWNILEMENSTHLINDLGFYRELPTFLEMVLQVDPNLRPNVIDKSLNGSKFFYISQCESFMSSTEYTSIEENIFNCFTQI